MPFVKGIDVSVYDPVVNWAKVRAQGYRFALIRSSYGVENNKTKMDTMFQSHWAGAKAAGMLRGPYHYLRAAQDGTAQAIDFLNIVNLQPGDLPPALDLEESYNEGASNAQWIKNTELFLKKVKQETGITPMVYSRGNFLDEHLTQNWKAPAWAKDYRMWVAHWTYEYGENIKPIEGKGWPPYIFWQYSGERDYLDGITNEYGVPVLVDFDVFKGTLEELYALAGGTAPVPVKYTIKAGDTFENIAREFNVSLSELLNANPHLVISGTVLTIPQRAGPIDPDPIDPLDPIDPVDPTKFVTYVVKSGDTLSAIASKFGSSVKTIADLNHIQDPNLIHVGQVLKIPK